MVKKNNAEFYKKGAEAEILEAKFDKISTIIKKRIPKNYREITLDENIRKKRTRSEAKILNDLFNTVNVPKIISVNEKEASITMEFINGVLLKDIIENKKNLCELAGSEIKKIHDRNIIHGDLTTSNLIYFNKKIYFIDFGLGYYSKKVEDKATDLIVFKKTFNATHSKIKDSFDLVMKGYLPSKEMLIRMAEIEKRARYH